MSIYETATLPITVAYIDTLLSHGIDYERWTPSRGFYACKCGIESADGNERERHQDQTRRVAGEEHDAAIREAIATRVSEARA